MGRVCNNKVHRGTINCLGKKTNLHKMQLCILIMYVY